MPRPWPLVLTVLLAPLAGCDLQKQVEPTGSSVLKKFTQDIIEYVPEQHAARLVDPEVKVTNPVTGPLEAYGPMMGQVSDIGVTHSLNLFHATHERYPETHEEFMKEIVTGPGMELPVLPARQQYAYDVAEHKLVILAPEAAAADAAADTAEEK